jgi:hypothetical protein
MEIMALPSTGRSDRVAQLRYRIRADRPTREELWILDGKKVLRRVKTGFASRSGREATVWLRLPAVAGGLRFCARALDQAGRRTTTSCAPLKIRFVARAMAARGIAGQFVPLRFRLEWKRPARVVIEIMSGTRRLQTLRTTRSTGSGLRTFRWRSRPALAGQALSFCIVAHTAVGERSVKACARLRLTRPR